MSELEQLSKEVQIDLIMSDEIPTTELMKMIPTNELRSGNYITFDLFFPINSDSSYDMYITVQKGDYQELIAGNSIRETIQRTLKWCMNKDIELR